MNPKELNLQADKQYFWNVDDIPASYKLTVLNEQIEKEILSRLSEIDSENISENERLFEKVRYLQIVSDLYPEQVDLYWLSAQWLLDFKTSDEKEFNRQLFWLDKCNRNLNSKIPE